VRAHHHEVGLQATGKGNDLRRSALGVNHFEIGFHARRAERSKQLFENTAAPVSTSAVEASSPYTWLTTPSSTCSKCSFAP